MTLRATLFGLKEPFKFGWYWFLTLLLFIVTTPKYTKMEQTDKLQQHPQRHHDEIQCPSFAENSACPCYKFDDGLFLECPGTTAVSLRSILQLISSPIQSLSVYDFDRTVTSLSQDLFAVGVHIRHLQFSLSHLQMLKDNSLKNLRATLESLSIVNGKLTQVPQKALTEMQKLMVLDFESNEISEISDYSFYGLHLVKLNMKGNLLEKIPEHAFSGLEDSMAEIDLSENKLKTFPMSALRRLDYLRSLRLSLNEISTLHGDGTSRLDLLVFLDISSNMFEEINIDCFRTFPSLKTLSLYSNLIEIIHKNAFISLNELQSLDISHNKIIYLDPAIFDANKKLKTIDLSHNHIHYISGVFSNLPELREIFLSENNILELPNDAFTNSTKIDVIYLETNAIKRIDPDVFNTLYNLEQLYLSTNFIIYLPQNLFEHTTKLTSLSLDGNMLIELEKGTFNKVENLREIRLHNNKLENIKQYVFYPLPGLLELHLQNNFIKKIENGSLNSLKSLQHINLQGNYLQELNDIFPHNKTSSLFSIQLDSNQIIYFNNETFKDQLSVQIMWLGHNQLYKLERTLFKDLIHIERIYLTNNSIEIIDNNTFDDMKLLKFLDLSLNKLKIITINMFSNLYDLEELNLSTNLIIKIQSNSFKYLQKIKLLDLSNNFIKILHRNLFQDQLPITILNLKNSTIMKIEMGTFNDLNNLNELNIENNFINSNDIKQLDIPSLRTLKISNNNFSDLLYENNNNIFDKVPSLQILLMENCLINNLHETIFSKTTNLVKIDLGFNQLKLINRNIFNGLNVFKELRLNNNLINDFPHIALYNISTLETLTLAGNLLTNVDFFKLNGLPNLRHLDLNDNVISSLSGFNAVNLTQLDYVDLTGNILLTLPANFFQHSISLQKVDLSCNRFKQIPSSALSDNSLARLSWLNLTGNPLNHIYTVIDEHHYPSLKEIHISKTNLTLLTSKDFDAFPSLQHLYLVQNRINRVSPGAFISLNNLLTLDLSINELELLPKERLQGLKLLRILNVSHNSLKELEEFTMDLMSLEILDLSYNQLDRIGKNTLKNLIVLQELHIMGNRITTISSDGFKNLRKLKVIDLRRNYFEQVPLKALKMVETHIKSLRLEDNPLHCSCDSQELWEWLRDHQKWTIEENGHYLKCEQPSELRGKIFLNMEPKQFCDAPLILKLAIQDIQPYSVLVSWQSREHSGISGYQVVYHSMDSVDEVRGKTLNRSANSAKLIKLTSSTRYLICVLGLGNWLTYQIDLRLNDSNQVSNSIGVGGNGVVSVGIVGGNNIVNNDISNDELKTLLRDSSTSRCTEVTTLTSTPSLITDENGLSGHGIIHSLLTRRLGLIVGCCLGIIVFIVLISVLGYLKLKKQRIDNAKRQQPVPPEYISYRHFSIPHEEINRDGIITGGSGCHHHHHPNPILGTTMLNS